MSVEVAVVLCFVQGSGLQGLLFNYLMKQPETDAIIQTVHTVIVKTKVVFL